MQSPQDFFKFLYSGVQYGMAEIRLLYQHKKPETYATQAEAEAYQLELSERIKQQIFVIHNKPMPEKGVPESWSVKTPAIKIYRPATNIHTGNFDYLAEMNQDYHIYHRVNVSAAAASKKADMTQAVALWLEIDNNTPDIPERLIDAHFPPTMLIHSGSGFHAYWLLKTPLMIEKEAMRYEVERTLEGMILDWGIDSGGDKHTKDITRILRTPFYRNVKDKYAPNYPLCTVLWADDSLGDRYRFEYLHKRYAPLGRDRNQQIIRRELPVIQKGQYPKWIEQWLSTGAAQGERNKRLYDVSRALWDMGHDHMDILNIVSSRAVADGLNQSEISTTVKSACANPRNAVTAIPSHVRRVMQYEDNHE